jgi:DUF1680 family protein
VTLTEGFWKTKREVWRRVTLRDAFEKFEKGGALENFDRVRDGLRGGHQGPPWTGGLVLEMIRGASDFLVTDPDPELEALMDRFIGHITAAQGEDGYLNPYTTLERPDGRWNAPGGDQRWQHECYNHGCLIEAGVHHYRATGKTALLKAGVKAANLMCRLTEPPESRNIVTEHPLPEEALVELYELFAERPGLKAELGLPVDERQYLHLVEYWMAQRGHHEGRQDWGAYAQDHKPVLQQETIEGHAVRATLMCAGLAAVARHNGRDEYRRSALRLWENMVHRRMHITGGTGAFADDEKFGGDYVLPNNAYLETCAAVGAGFFHHRMNLLLGEARFADELERVLFNGALAGTSLSGDRYFYENPLVAGKERERWAWHGCPCCPPMFVKIYGALPGYLYATDETGLYVNQYASSTVEARVKGQDVRLSQETRYPWDGTVTVRVLSDAPSAFDLYLRVPGWCEGATLTVNGEHVGAERVRGYARVSRSWKNGDTVVLTLPMPARQVAAHPKVEANTGRLALMRGPLVYCVESADNPSGVRNLSVASGASLTVEERPDLLGGVTVIKTIGTAMPREEWADTLYRTASAAPEGRPVEVTAVPYYANANRGPVEMAVWLAAGPEVARTT